MSKYYPPSDIKLYRDGFVTVEARQWDGTKGSTYEILWWVEMHNGSLYQINHLGSERPSLQVGTPEGIVNLTEGDYLLRTEKNDFYPCQEDIFLTKYERTENV